MAIVAERGFFIQLGFLSLVTLSAVMTAIFLMFAWPPFLLLLWGVACIAACLLSPLVVGVGLVLTAALVTQGIQLVAECCERLWNGLVGCCRKVEKGLAVGWKWLQGAQGVTDKKANILPSMQQADLQSNEGGTKRWCNSGVSINLFHKQKRDDRREQVMHNTNTNSRSYHYIGL